MRGSLRKALPVIVGVLIIIALILWYNRPPAPVLSTPLDAIPPYTDTAYAPVAGNLPEFSNEDMTVDAYEYYSDLDALGRCGYAMACLGTELMPTEERQSISHIKPSGWVQGQYDFVDGKSLYNRCHLIGFQLAGENDNEKNLITGTRYCNVEGMLPFENMIADYIKETENHVIYRVTPVYHDNDLVASGIQMEAWSVEDGGEGICFNVYVYNVQPGVAIDYSTGENSADAAFDIESVEDTVYILNIHSFKFHTEDCAQGQSIKEENREIYHGSRGKLIQQGYDPSGCCDP